MAGLTLDDVLCRYFDLFARTDTAAVDEQLRCELLSERRLRVLYEEHVAGDNRATGAATFGTNRSAPIDLIDELADTALSTDPVTWGPWSHPHLGPRAPELYGRVGAFRLGFLSNPAAPPELLSKSFIHAPVDVARNPNTSEGTVDVIRNRYKLVVAGFTAARHTTPTALWAAAATSDDATMRAQAYRKDQLTTEQLNRAFEREVRGGERHTEALDVLCDRMGRHHPTDALDEHVSDLARPASRSREAPLRVEVADIVARLTERELDAARALVRGGFDGTVAELLDIATTFTA